MSKSVIMMVALIGLTVGSAQAQCNSCPALTCSGVDPVCGTDGSWHCVGDPCGGCGTIQDDGSCADPCAGGGRSSCSGSCGTCGSMQDNGDGGCYCNDPCVGGGGNGGCGGCGGGCSSCGQIGAPCQYDEDCCNMNCAFDFGFCQNPEYDDPIIIDLKGAGFLLTSIQSGVTFDFQGNGKPVQMSWTAKGADVGFLALDRNGNGKIDNGQELFGNVTPQPAAKNPNGFLALAVFDLPANGGNRDGWISNKDTIFPKLQIWVDSNHDGISQPGELTAIQQSNIRAISLAHSLSAWVDAYGNKFRYRGEIVWQKPVAGQLTATIYDVILQQGSHSNGGAN
jgi:hypothetical protein